MGANNIVLVTGAGGFIGSHVADSLVRDGNSVRAFVRYNSRNDSGMLAELDENVLEQIEIFTGDLEDPHAVREAVQGVGTVYHLGALIAIPYSFRHPSDVVHSNVLGTLNVLEACRQNGVAKVVQLSTSEVYGSALYVPIDEKHPLQAQSPYAATKIGSDQLALSYYRSFELPVAIARPFNTYGPRQSGRAVIPTIISQALSEAVVKIGSVTPTRDFCYVEDTVAGLIAIASCEATVGEIINLGTGRETPISELVDLIFQLVDKPVTVEHDPQRIRPGTSEVMRLCASTEKAKKLIGWEPRWELCEGLSRTIKWLGTHQGLIDASVYNV